MQIHFAEPVFLSLLLLLPLALLGAARLRSAGPLRRWFIVAVRLLLLLLLVLALSRLEVSRRSRALTVYFVLDQSDSIPAEQRNRAAEIVREMTDDKPPADEAGVIVFGDNASIESFALNTFEFPAAIRSVLETTRTDISGALRLALSAFPNANMRRIVLLTDGNENSGSSLQVARLARNENIPVDIVPLRYDQRGDTQVEKIVVPQQTSQDSPFDLKVFLSSEKETAGRLRIFEDGDLIVDQQVDVAAGKNPPLVLPRRLEDAGFHRYEAILETPGDTRPQNNRALSFTNVKGDPRVLYIEGDQTNTNYLAAALLAEKIQVDFGSPADLPMRIEELQSYDSLVLSNVHAGEMTEDQMKMIEAAVRDLGLGLVMVGGEDSYGAGGYQDSPIERALPVSMDVKQKKVLPNGALAVVLHTCEFPNGNAWARDITIAALDVLSAQDYFGVAYYGASPGGGVGGGAGGWGDFWLWEDENGSGLMQTGNKRAMRAKIRGCNPSDMPSFDPTLRLAYESLKKLNTQAKHIVVISDGDASPPTQGLVNDIRDEGITVSAVSVFPHSGQTVETMQQMAYWGAGNFYSPMTANELPRIFIKEASIVRRSLIFEETFAPKFTAPSETLEGFAGLPALHGYVVTSDKDLATTALRTDKDDPLLAHWRYGLGKTVAFTSDAKNKWASDWVAWDGYAKFWSQVLRWSLRETSSSNLQVSTELKGGRGRVIVDALDLDGNFRNFLEFDAVVLGPDLEPQKVRVRQVGPGRYEGEFDANEIGSYMVRLTTGDEETGAESVVSGAALSYSPEYQAARSNDEFLERLARESGGEVVGPGYNAFSHNLPRSSRPTPIWPWLLLASVILLPIDVLVRRVYVEELAAAAWKDVAATARAIAGRQRQAEGREEAMEGLMAAKKRVGTEREKKKEEDEARREFRERLASAESPAEGRSVFEEPRPGTGPVRRREKETVSAEDSSRRTAPPDGSIGGLLEAKRRARKKME